MDNKKRLALAIAALGVAWPAAAQPVKPISEKPVEPEEYRDRDTDVREAYRRGYEAGFERGYAKGLAEGDRRSGAIAPPPPEPRLGPIRITGAYYGTSSKNCDATHWLANRANGKRSYSIEVSNDICGDPAHGQRKELNATYLCGDIEKTASANEHRTIYLNCSS